MPLNLERQLNPQQYKAVTTIEGPLLILAGAGSGKTRVITFRVAHLIENRQVRPEQILAVTFTNKAAEQMKNRVLSLLRTQRFGNPLISTFHSFCVRILRRYIPAIGYGRDFSIYDEADQSNLMKSVLREIDVDEKLLNPRSVLSRISFAKNHGLAPENLYQRAHNPVDERMAVAFELYEKKLRQANALDFDDLLLKAVSVLESSPTALEALNNQYHYIMVDEYQDTNRIQYQLIRQLTRQRQNLCVVGDEDQSIYGWRGADIQNILSFEIDYPNAGIIKLEQNYRSTKNILDAAGAVVANNQARKGKNLWTEQTGGEPVTFYEAGDGEAEALFVAQQILSFQRLYPPDPIAVLYRTNFQSRLLEEACRRNGIKYSVVGGFSFYERAEIKDLLAYLKLCLNLHDSVSLFRVINTPPRGIGKTTLDSLEQEGRARGLSIWDTIQTALSENRFTSRTLHALSIFSQMTQSFIESMKSQTTSSLIHQVMEKSGYLQWLESEDTEESQSRIDNLKELVSAARDSENRGESLRDFLDHAALVSDTDEFDERAKVTLMTLHSAKGLEFPLVFMVGMEEGLFPHSRSMLDQHGVEEERRLCYVGMTRARRKLILTRARMRRFLGGESVNQTELSCFIREIPQDLLQNFSQVGIPKKTAYDGPTYNTRESIQEFYMKRGKQVDLSPSQKGTTRKTNGFASGTAVRHPKYGIGTVLRCEGEGEESKVTVSFPGYGLKKLVPKYASLEKV
jgi:DNA helicase II / ATP-dependent DNA helicase PcrA